jgi:hypothetical protein
MSNLFVQKQVILKTGTPIDTQSLIPDFRMTDTIEDLFRQLQKPYPKFFKMDALCKWATYSTMLLEHAGTLTSGDPYGTALLMYTHHGCFETDLKYWETAKQQFASPALFVYTLPSIMLGEIAIYLKIKGYQNCSIVPDMMHSHVNTDVEAAYTLHGCDNLLVGWIDVFNDKAAVQLMHISTNKTELPFSSQIFQDFQTVQCSGLYNYE